MKSRHFKEISFILFQLKPLISENQWGNATKEYLLWKALVNGLADTLEKLQSQDCRFDRNKWNQMVHTGRLD